MPCALRQSHLAIRLACHSSYAFTRGRGVSGLEGLGGAAAGRRYQETAISAREKNSLRAREKKMGQLQTSPHGDIILS